MRDFTSALYLGLRHGSDELRPWAQLTLGVPAALREDPLACRVAGRVAALAGCEAGVAATSTLHVALDLFGLLARDPVVLYVDAGTYAIQRWGTERARALGVPVRTFAEHDPASLARALARDEALSRRPVVVADGYCPACGRGAPLGSYLRLVRHRAGLLVVDDTQAVGVLGEAPTPAHPYGEGGGGSLRLQGIRGRDVLLVVSLAKAFGVPMAVLAGSSALVQRFAEASETRVHCSPPSTATLHAAVHALAVEAREGDRRRDRLARNVLRFRRGLAARGIQPSAGIFPVQALLDVGGARAVRVHEALVRGRVGTVLTAGHGGRGPRVTFVITARHTHADIDAAIDATVAAVHQPGAERVEPSAAAWSPAGVLQVGAR